MREQRQKSRFWARDQSFFPIWYRAQVFIPLIGIGFVYAGSVHTIMNLYALPYYLTGGWDWGCGNVFTFAKIFLWGALVLGCLANTWAVRKLPEGSIWELSRQVASYNAIHLASIGTLILTAMCQKTFSDLIRQVAFLFASLFLIVPIIVRSRRWPLWIALPIPAALGVLWGFVPLGITPPWK